MPVSGGQIFVVPVQIKEEAGAEKIPVSLGKIGALIPVIAFDVEQEPPASGQIVGLPIRPFGQNALA